jgi:hypothetical protein
MANKISQCNIWDRFFDSNKALKEHIDKNHRITDSKIVGLNSLIAIIPLTNWFSAVEIIPH